MSLFPIVPPVFSLPSASLVDSLESNASVGTFSFTANLGPATASRLIVAVCCWAGDTTRSLSSVSIAGGAATIHASTAHLGGCGVASRAVAAGTSGTVSFTLSAGTGCGGIYVYSVLNLASSTPIDTAAQNDLAAGTPHSVSAAIDVAKNGIIIGGVGNYISVSGSLVGITQDDHASLDEGDILAGHFLATVAETNRTLSVNLDGGEISQGAGALVAAAWR